MRLSLMEHAAKFDVVPWVDLKGKIDEDALVTVRLSTDAAFWSWAAQQALLALASHAYTGMT